MPGQNKEEWIKALELLTKQVFLQILDKYKTEGKFVSKFSPILNGFGLGSQPSLVPFLELIVINQMPNKRTDYAKLKKAGYESFWLTNPVTKKILYGIAEGPKGTCFVYEERYHEYLGEVYDRLAIQLRPLVSIR